MDQENSASVQLAELAPATSANLPSNTISTPVPTASSTDDDDNLTIARRTRSHLHIDDFVLNDNLDFPDVDRSLYNPDSPEEADAEYKKFLYQCYSTGVEQGTDTNTDDNDPAYVFNDDILSHGWSFNLDEALQQQSQQQLSEEARPSNAYGGDHMIEEREDLCPVTVTHTDEANESITGLGQVINICDTFSPNKLARVRKIDIFGKPEFVTLMNQQLRQHIQLLMQTYLLTKHTTNMQDKADEVEDHLNAYMKVFKNRKKPSNLLPAVELVRQLGTPKELKSSIRLSWRHLPVPEPVKRIIDSRPDIFMYETLLPEVAYSTLPRELIPKKPKIYFTLNEDKLLAYALNEFKGESSQYAYIASLLMAAKTKMQISNHIKNLKRGPGNENNPVKLYLLQGKLPEIDLYSDSKIREKQPEKTIELKEERTEENNSEERVEKEEKKEHNKTVDRLEEIRSGDFSCEDDEHLTSPNPVNEDNMDGSHDQSGEIPPSPQFDCHDPLLYHNHDDMMNMNLEDLMTASTTISKNVTSSGGNTNQSGICLSNNCYGSISDKNTKNLKMRKSMLNLMSQKFLVTSEMGDLIIEDFIKAAFDNLNERNYIHLLQLLTELMRKESKRTNDDHAVVLIYNEIAKFLTKIGAPKELRERLVLFLNLDQADKCGCALSYLHWMRFFEFINHVEMYHESEAVEKKLLRLVDALQKEDPHKVRLATANLVSKHPLLQRELDSLSLDGKPHPSLFINEDDFDDITEPITLFDLRHNPTDGNNNDNIRQLDLFNYEHFDFKLTPEEINYASQSCPCKCHHQPGQSHCNRCNLKFVKGRMYLVNKIKPSLAEWSYSATPPPPPPPQSAPQPQLRLQPPQSQPQTQISPPPMSSLATEETPMPTIGIVGTNSNVLRKYTLTPRQYPRQVSHEPAPSQQQSQQQTPSQPRPKLEWTFEEDKEILEFCRHKAELNDENISFDTTTFEELVSKRRLSSNSPSTTSHKKSAHEIAERFNHLMEMYRVEGAS